MRTIKVSEPTGSRQLTTPARGRPDAQHALATSTQPHTGPFACSDGHVPWRLQDPLHGVWCLYRLRPSKPQPADRMKATLVACQSPRRHASLAGVPRREGPVRDAGLQTGAAPDSVRRAHQTGGQRGELAGPKDGGLARPLRNPQRELLAGDSRARKATGSADDPGLDRRNEVSAPPTRESACASERSRRPRHSRRIDDYMASFRHAARALHDFEALAYAPRAEEHCEPDGAARPTHGRAA